MQMDKVRCFKKWVLVASDEPGMKAKVVGFIVSASEA